MSAVAGKAAPKTFNQLRLATQITVGVVGMVTGYQQKRVNDRLWNNHFKTQWAANAKAEAERQEALRKPSGDLPEGVPPELAELANAFRQ